MKGKKYLRAKQELPFDLIRSPLGTLQRSTHRWRSRQGCCPRSRRWNLRWCRRRWGIGRGWCRGGCRGAGATPGAISVDDAWLSGGGQLHCMYLHQNRKSRQVFSIFRSLLPEKEIRAVCSTVRGFEKIKTSHFSALLLPS